MDASSSTMNTSSSAMDASPSFASASPSFAHESTAPKNSDLLDFVAQMSGEGTLRVEESLGDGFVRLRVAEAERRQAKHDIRYVEDAIIELLRNSRDAQAQQIFVASSKHDNLRKLLVIDNGSGIPKRLHERVFDARVTSKLDTIHSDRWGVHGRGMALYSIRENAKHVQVMASGIGLGCAIQMVFDTTQTPERADQSSWPTIGRNEDGEQAVIRGPHNIIRSCCEFALEEQGELELWFGSPAEIVATIRQRIRPRISESQLLFINSMDDLPLFDRIVVAADAQELTELACSLGLEISERTAHRIIAGRIDPVASVSTLVKQGRDSSTTEPDLHKDRRGLKLSENDTEMFKRLIERDFRYLEDRYYLSLVGEPRVRVSQNRIVITLDIDKQD